MPKNASIIDQKPSNEFIVDQKPSNEFIIDHKPKMEFIPSDTTDQLFEVVLGAGQPIGLLLTLTYPTAGTVQNPETQ